MKQYHSDIALKSTENVGCSVEFWPPSCYCIMYQNGIDLFVNQTLMHGFEERTGATFLLYQCRLFESAIYGLVSVK